MTSLFASHFSASRGAQHLTARRQGATLPTAMSLVTFQFPDGREHDLRDPEPRAVLGELERIGSPAAVALADAIKRAASGDRSAIVKLGVAVDWFLALLRALDHIRNGARAQPGGEPADHPGGAAESDG